MFRLKQCRNVNEESSKQTKTAGNYCKPKLNSWIAAQVKILLFLRMTLILKFTFMNSAITHIITKRNIWDNEGG